MVRKVAGGWMVVAVVLQLRVAVAQEEGQAAQGAPAANEEPLFVPGDVAIDTDWFKAASLCGSGAEAKAQLVATEQSGLQAWCGKGSAKAFLDVKKELSPVVVEKFAAALGCALGDEQRKQLPAEKAAALAAACDASGKPIPAAMKVAAGAFFEYREETSSDSDSATPPRTTTTAVSTSPIATTGDIVVRAIAGFLEKRAKAEFRLFILKRLRNKLCDEEDGHPDWMPNTCAFIGTAADDASLPLSLGPGFRAALVLDAVELPDRIVEKKLSEGDKDKLALRVAFEAARVIVQHRSIQVLGQMLQELGTAGALHSFACKADDVAPCERLLGALRQVGAVARIVFENQLVDLPPEQAATALVTELEKALQLKLDATAILGEVKALQQAGKAVETALAALDDRLSASVGTRAERMGHVLRAVGSVTDAAIAFLIAASRLTPELEQQFAVAIEPLTAARDLTVAFVEANLPRIVALVVSRAAGVAEIPGSVVRTVSFAVDLATAKSSEEAQAVIENVAAPVGAWQTKRDDGVLSLTGFVGLAYGQDRLRVRGEDVSSDSMAPLGAVGADINFAGWPHPNFRLGLFASLIDVGQLLSYASDTEGKVKDSMGNDEEVEIEKTPPLGFAQVFSPGLFVRVGLGDSPATVGAGIARVPQSRTVTIMEADGTRTDPKDVDIWRASVWLAIDVTILPF